MVYNSLSGWIVEFSSRRAEKELEAMTVDFRADFARLVDMIQMFGLPEIREPHVKHLSGKLWEMRLRGRDGIARAIYLAAHTKRVVVLHCFQKKTQKTPDDALIIALKRAKEAGLL